MEKCPITGKSCNKEKFISVNKSIDGVKETYHCCEECGGCVIPPGFMALPNVLAQNVIKLITLENQYQISCSNCHYTLTDIKLKGRLGCPICYDAFRDQLLIFLPRIHGSNISHKGKTPKQMRLKEELRKAIEEERYEDAAKLKDTINRKNLETPD